MDKKGRVLFVLGGRPAADDWEDDMKDALVALIEAEEEMELTCRVCKSRPPEQYCSRCVNRRGSFRAASVGMSIGGGQKVSRCKGTRALPSCTDFPLDPSDVAPKEMQHSCPAKIVGSSLLQKGCRICSQ